MTKSKKSRGALDVFKCAAHHTGLKGLNLYCPDMVTDGIWCIKKSALAGKVKLPGFIKDELLKAATGNNPGVTFQAFVDRHNTTQYPLTLHVDHCGFIASFGGKTSPVLKMSHGESFVVMNAYYVSLVEEIFPGCNWVATKLSNPVFAIHGGEIVALVMPIKSKSVIPGFSTISSEFDGPPEAVVNSKCSHARKTYVTGGSYKCRDCDVIVA